MTSPALPVETAGSLVLLLYSTPGPSGRKNATGAAALTTCQRPVSVRLIVVLIISLQVRHEMRALTTKRPPQRKELTEFSGIRHVTLTPKFPSRR